MICVVFSKENHGRECQIRKIFACGELKAEHYKTRVKKWVLGSGTTGTGFVENLDLGTGFAGTGFPEQSLSLSRSVSRLSRIFDYPDF